MKRYKRCYILMGFLVGSCMLLGMQVQEKKDISIYLGQEVNVVEGELSNIAQKQGVEWAVDDTGQVTTLYVRDSEYKVNGIAPGDPVEKIYEIYPDGWIIREAHHVWIGMGQLNHFGVVTDQIIFVLDGDDKIQEIRIGYTADFVTDTLPASNEAFLVGLEGVWKSNQERILAFKEGSLKDNILDNIWDEQYYTVLAPNEIQITRVKKEQTEKVKLRIWLEGNRMTIFAIDSRGVPISKTIETFDKVN